MPKRNKKNKKSIEDKPTRPMRPVKNSYFKDIIHMMDDQGALCGAAVEGDFNNTDPEKVNCNKCHHFMEHPGLLEAKRKREKIEVIQE